jgi:hypothetical protein
MTWDCTFDIYLHWLYITIECTLYMDIYHQWVYVTWDCTFDIYLHWLYITIECTLYMNIYLQWVYVTWDYTFDIYLNWLYITIECTLYMDIHLQWVYVTWDYTFDIIIQKKYSKQLSMFFHLKDLILMCIVLSPIACSLSTSSTTSTDVKCTFYCNIQPVEI